MGGAHAHRHDGAESDVEVPPRARAVLLGLLAAAFVATLAGLVLLWPDGGKVDEVAEGVSFAAPGVTFPRAEVTSVQPPCATPSPNGADNSDPVSDGTDCGQIKATVDDGEDAGTDITVRVPTEVLDSGLEPGDTLKLIRTPAAQGQDVSYGFFGVERTFPVGLMLGLFVLAVLLVARWRGLMALVGLGFSLAMIATFMLPSLLSGQPGALVGVVGSAAIMFVVLYTTHGWSLRTSAALAGTLVGIALTAAIGFFSVGGTHLSGVVDDGGRILGSVAGDLSFQGLLSCAIIVAGLGVLNDVTITQASAVWEIRAASPAMSRRGVFASSMRIGRDHIASTIYTIVFAYAGTALTVLLLLHLYDRPFLELLASEEIGEEVVRTLATGIGLVLAVPITTAIAVATLPAGDGDL